MQILVGSVYIVCNSHDGFQNKHASTMSYTKNYHVMLKSKNVKMKNLITKLKMF